MPQSSRPGASSVPPVKTLLIDNYDSFTYNLFQLLARVNGVEPLVLANDDHEGWCRSSDSVDAIVISPGPGRPDVERDFGISRLALELSRTPILGVCLGHQGLCWLNGSLIEPAPEPFHGRTSPIRHSGHALFRGIPSPFAAARYHSLIATRISTELDVIARTEDDLVMAVAHRTKPHFGVQFHPESIATPHGQKLLENFRELVIGGAAKVQWSKPRDPRASRPSRFSVAIRRVLGAPEPERVFRGVFEKSATSIWLDSSRAIEGYSRFSILCFPSEQHGEVASYDTRKKQVVVEEQATGRVRHLDETIFDYLKREQRARAVPNLGLPCEFALGFVGYLGYELKADCGALGAHASTLPDARLAFCDRAYVFDHQNGEGTLLALHDADSEAVATQWLDQIERAFLVLPDDLPSDRVETPRQRAVGELQTDRSEYLHQVRQCLDAIRAGETYEVCLTNRVSLPFTREPREVYALLRRVSPAPYAAFLQFSDFAVASASPERFLTIDRFGVAESKPIKGTARRSPDSEVDRRAARDLAESEKERAENLMIVDLVRNDLGRVSEVGTVTVPRLFDVESYASVHQLVSTVRSQLRNDVDAVDCVRACFPGGSMTGAPKLRTMEIIDALEGTARGIYSGAIGYFSLNGATDLSMVIRTIVFHDGRALMGTGGAIVALSDPDAEFDETQLKIEALLDVLGPAVGERAG
jgi:para-aminobenzoate synthetase